MPRWLQGQAAAVPEVPAQTPPPPTEPSPGAETVADVIPRGMAASPHRGVQGGRSRLAGGTAAERLRFWVEEDDPEDAADRDMIRGIRKRVFEETQGLKPQDRDARAQQIANEMVGSVQSRTRQERIVQEVLTTLGGRLGYLQPFMEDPTVAEILVNAPGEVYIEKHGQLILTDARFRADRDVRAVVEAIASMTGRKFDFSTPVQNFHLPDGSRVNAVRWPVALRGTCVSIRKFDEMPNAGDMRRQGAIPDRDRVLNPSFLEPITFPRDVDAWDFLAWLFRVRKHVVVSGATSSGKTTLTNALMEFIPRTLRVVIIEDSAELQPPMNLHVVRLERRKGNVEGTGAVSLRELLVASLQLRPDIIVVGEVRSDEMAVYLEAISTGHDGSITTVHSHGPEDTCHRMVRLLRLDYPDVPTSELRSDVARAVKVIIHMKRDYSDAGKGLRVIERITSLEGLDEHGQFLLHDLYRWQDGRFVPTGHVPQWARGTEVSS